MKKIVNQINTFISKQLWLDFFFETINENIVKIIGTKDTSYNEENCIEIIFENVSHIKTILYDWTKDEENLFIQIENASRCEDIFGFKMDKTSTLFSIAASCHSKRPIWIVSKSIKFNLLKLNQS